MRRVDVADQLLHVEPDRHRVVPVPRSRLPGRLLTRERKRHVVEVTHVLGAQRIVDPDQPRLVTEELAHSDGALAVLGELRPVLGDRCLVIDPAARVRDGDRHRRETLGGRVDDDQGVLVPRCVPAQRAAAIPQIDHLPATPIRGDGSADLAPLREVALELNTYLLEALSDPTAVVRRALDEFRMHGRQDLRWALKKATMRRRASWAEWSWYSARASAAIPLTQTGSSAGSWSLRKPCPASG